MEKRLSARFNQFCFFFCWKTSALQIFGKLPVSGYCSGQTMNLKLDVINKSDKEVLHILVHFIKVSYTINLHWAVWLTILSTIKVVTYLSNNGSKKIERVVLAERRAEGCRANRNGIKSMKVNIVVPSLPPTNFTKENLFRFNYLLRVNAWHLSLIKRID